MLFKHQLFIFTLFILFDYHHSFATEHDLELSIRVSVDSIEVGEPLEVISKFTNIGEKPFFIERAEDNFGEQPAGKITFLSLLGQRDSCSFKMGPFFLEGTVDGRPLNFVPLLSKESFETLALPAINDPGWYLFPILRLKKPGVYKIAARYYSNGEARNGSIWPIWRGEIKSASVEVRLNPPSETKIEIWRERLISCLETQKNCGEAVGYFMAVRDQKAANVLSKLFRKDPTKTFLADAIVNQGRAEDAALIEETARNRYHESDPKFESYLLSLAERIRKPAICER